MADFKDELLAELHKDVNAPALAEFLLDRALEPALRNIAASTDNKIDDFLVSTLVPLLSPELKKFIRAEWAKLAPQPEQGQEVLGAPV